MVHRLPVHSPAKGAVPESRFMNLDSGRLEYMSLPVAWDNPIMPLLVVNGQHARTDVESHFLKW